ncbi:MAG TPA: GHMP kinase [Desulfobacteria bacterium]|nr:GHMP kinase [Desulfobacteria bacterium]
MIGIARAPGTCGELVQGKVNDVDFLITCPIDTYSTVKVELNESGTIEAGRGLSKVRRAVSRVFEYLDRAGTGAVIKVRSEIPRGKGMASSTADIAAACAAAALALNSFLSPARIAEIALSIEPTDGIMFNGIMMFDHIRGSLCRKMGTAPKIDVILVDLGGTVNTVRFNANKELNLLNSHKENEVKLALKKIEEALSTTGCETADAALIGEAATMSAFANQKILFKPELERLYKICREFGGIGVNVAHSGTIVGLLFQRGSFSSYNQIINNLSQNSFRVLGTNRIINGGVEVLREGVGEKEWQQLDTFTGEIFGRLKKNTG